MNHTLPEFVGTTVLDTIGLVIANVAPALRKKMKMEAPYRSIGFSVPGLAPQDRSSLWMTQ